jgi:hypothetical protein
MQILTSAAGHLCETRFAHDAQLACGQPLARTNYSTGKFYAIRITRTRQTADNSPQSALDSGRAEPPETALHGAKQPSHTPTALPLSRLPWRIAGLKRSTSPSCCWRYAPAVSTERLRVRIHRPVGPHSRSSARGRHWAVEFAGTSIAANWTHVSYGVCQALLPMPDQTMGR